MHGYSRPVRCSLLAIPTVLNLFIFPPHIYVRVTFRLLLLYLSRMPIKLLKKKKKKKSSYRLPQVFLYMIHVHVVDLDAALVKYYA